MQKMNKFQPVRFRFCYGRISYIMINIFNYRLYVLLLSNELMRCILFMDASSDIWVLNIFDG